MAAIEFGSGAIDAKDPCAAKAFPQGNAMQTSKKRLEPLFAIPPNRILPLSVFAHLKFAGCASAVGA